MEFNNSMKVEFLSKSSNEGFARVVIAAFVSQLDPTVEELAEIKTAVSEAVTNAVVHGYKDKAGSISLECSIKGNKVDITIEDKGEGIEDIAKAREPLFTTGDESERSGMGFTVMETFMDDVKVLSKIGEGTVVKMSKTITSVK